MALLSPGAPFSGDAPSSTPVSPLRLVLTQGTVPELSGRRSGTVPKDLSENESQIAPEKPKGPPVPQPRAALDLATLALATLVFELLSTRLRLPKDLIAAALASLPPNKGAPNGPATGNIIAIEDLLEDLYDGEDIPRLLRLESTADNGKVINNPQERPEPVGKEDRRSLLQLVDDNATLSETRPQRLPRRGPG